MNRMTNNDKVFGPITIARWRHLFMVELNSGDNDEDKGCRLTLVGFGWAIRVGLPQWIQPRRREIKGENFAYTEENPRRYGVSLSRLSEEGYNFFQIYYGEQSNSSLHNKCWSAHLPWKEWQIKSTRLYNPDGSLFYEGGPRDFSAKYENYLLCPSVTFIAEDYDKKRFQAKCVIEEREWTKGSGWFSWLRFFRRNMVRRVLDLRFSEEVGPEKGSWKGGTLGHSTDMRAGETPEDSFRRYCGETHSAKGRKYMIKFLGKLDTTPETP